MKCLWGFEFGNSCETVSLKFGLCCEFWAKGLRANLAPKKKKKKKKKGHVSMMRCHLTVKTN